MSKTIQFKLNEPHVLALADTIPDEYKGNWIYPTMDGRSLEIPARAGEALAALEIQRGEEISIGRYQQSPNGAASWVICLTPRSEVARADREREQEARKLAEATRHDTAGQLSASIASIRKMPQPERREAASASESTQGHRNVRPRRGTRQSA